LFAPFHGDDRFQIEAENGFDFADEQARAKAASAGHTVSWKTGSNHVDDVNEVAATFSVRQ